MIRATVEDMAIAGDGEAFLILLKTEEDDILPIMIGYEEARAIAVGKQSEKPLRPLTHDLLLSMIEMMSGTLKRVEVSELKHDTFYGRIVVEHRGIEIEVDARPSDALALAVRVDAPIFISKEVIEAAGMTDFGDGGVEA